jgi:outer membrane protein OmpA-like peptidoglycan-associated protein
MTCPSATRAALAVICLYASACAKVAIEEPKAPERDLIVLLPDSPDGTVGRATVSNGSGAVELSEARASTRVSDGRAPSTAQILSEEDVEREFGQALAAFPPAPQAFTLYFLFDSEDLTPDSQALLTDTLQAVRERPVPDVLVVGHTDTTGPPGLNYELALRRAQTVRALLVAAGLEEDTVAVASHGESQPLVPTADGIYEPRNRRVVITVR